MKRKIHGRNPRWVRAVSVLLVPIYMASLPGYSLANPISTTGVDVAIYEQTDLNEEVPAKIEKAPVRVNRSIPSHVGPSAELVFSAQPTVEEISRARVFSEPLVAADQTEASLEENAALVVALLAFQKRTDREDASSLAGFLESYPNTAWRTSLLTNLGISYYHWGRFSKAIEAWEAAWNAGKSSNDPKIAAVADRAVGELARMYSRIGELEALTGLLAETDSRQVTGRATELVNSAREGLLAMKSSPEFSYRCGPLALGRVATLLTKRPEMNAQIEGFKSTKDGTSLRQVLEYSKKLGVKLQAAKRSPGAEVITPAIVHWKIGHFAALSRKHGDLYLSQDPTFVDDLLVSRSALDQESSGYFLVPAGKLPAGWVPVDGKEADEVWGKGKPPEKDEDETKCDDAAEGGCGGCGGTPMAQYQFHALLVSLNIFDTPVGYTPAYGPSVYFRVNYNQREAGQPTTFYYSNLGPKWMTNWTSWVSDDPSQTPYPSTVKVYERSGGASTFTFPSGGGANVDSVPSNEDGSVLKHRSDGLYERSYSNGSKALYELSDGSTTVGRRVFLTAIIDPYGNQVTLSYDSSFRIVAITDALGQVTTLDYGVSGKPLLITKVTDPFGRFATFEYNSSGRMIKITDIVGITSEFTYDGDFINSLTTPYGTTRFAYHDSGSGADQIRWLKATDPMGASEIIESRPDAPGLAYSLPTAEVPSASGFQTNNAYLDNRNTFYWSKKAIMAGAEGQYTKAKILHWLHKAGDPYTATGVIESEKKALEGRVWYNYPGQAAPYFEGTFNSPSKMARVLDDGTTQLYQLEYNARGKTTKAIDPLGRETAWEYAGNGEDLIAVKQKNGSAYDVLAEFGPYTVPHLPASVIDAAGEATNIVYNGRGQVTSVTNAKNETTTLLYGVTDPEAAGYGRVTSVVAPTSATLLTLTYDACGRVETATDSEGYTVTYDYDAMDRVVSRAYPDGTFEFLVYKHLDLERSKDRMGRWTHIFYDAMRRTVAVRDPAGRITKYDWCTCGALHGIIDANGNRTSFEYDIQERLVEKKYANNTTIQFSYEGTTSRLRQKVDAKAQVTAYSYFKDNALQGISYSGGVATPSLALTYDSAYQRLATMADGIGTTVFAYHPVQQLGALNISSVDGPLANDTITNSYDVLGRLLSRTVDGVVSSQTYDALWRIDTVTNPLGQFENSYANATSRLSKIERPNGVDTQFEYFGNVGDQRLRRIKNELSPTTVISEFGYDYNPVGNIKNWKQTQSGVEKEYALSYDAADQLIAATLSTMTGPTSPEKIAYLYDNAGNRLSDQKNESVTGASYNNLNQLMGRGSGGTIIMEGQLNEPATVTVGGNSAPVNGSNVFRASVEVAAGTNLIPIVATDASGNVTTKNAVVSVPAEILQTSFTYDLNGNMVGDGSSTYSWDAKDRLVAILYSNGTRTEIKYDGFDRWVEIVEKDASLSVLSARKMIWSGLEMVEQRDANNSVVRRYYPQGYTDLVASSGYYYTKDNLGSVREVTNESGAVVARYEYDLYGNPTKISGSQDSDFLFTGHYNHLNSKLAFAPYRQYSAQFGRWISRDPIGEMGPDGPNLYAYVRNNPVLYYDETGEFAWVAAGAAIGAAVNMAATYAANGGNVTGQQMAAAALSGAISGGVGALAGPLGGTLAKGLGQAASGLLAKGLGAGVSAAGSALGQAAANEVDPCHASSIGNAALYGGLGQMGSSFIPVRGMSSLKQAGYFGPKTAGGLMGTGNARSLMGSYGAASGVGAASNFGGPF